MLAEGGVPGLAELVLHNGTVYRWNRPVYAVDRRRPHLRVENRVLPAGPTVTDVLANTALYYGLVRSLADEPRPVWSRLPVRRGGRQLRRGLPARHRRRADLAAPRAYRWGGDACPPCGSYRRSCCRWRRPGWRRGASRARTVSAICGVIEERCRHRANGASWQAAAYHRAVDSGLDREKALAAVTRRYCELVRSGEPVHTWPFGA